jgi:hypothetical protein
MRKRGGCWAQAIHFDGWCSLPSSYTEKKFLFLETVQLRFMATGLVGAAGANFSQLQHFVLQHMDDGIGNRFSTLMNGRIYPVQGTFLAGSGGARVD